MKCEECPYQKENPCDFPYLGSLYLPSTITCSYPKASIILAISARKGFGALPLESMVKRVSIV